MLKSGHWAYEIAVVAMVCVLSIFFVPLAHGPYSVVHGPITALRALRNKLQLIRSIWLAALQVSASGLTQGVKAIRSWVESMLDADVEFPALNAVLRC